MRKKYNFSEVLAEGNFGKVEVDREAGVVRKTPLAGKCIGEYEVELGKKMGEAGFSPKVFPESTNSEIIMELAEGKPLWKGYRRDEDNEPEMMAKLAGRQGLAALLYMHKELKFAHNDAHVKQFLISGDKIQLIDFGLSKPIKEMQDAGLALTDLSKSYLFLGLGRFEDEPAVRVVNKYRDIKGGSRKAKEDKQAVIQEYYNYISQ